MIERNGSAQATDFVYYPESFLITLIFGVLTGNFQITTLYLKTRYTTSLALAKKFEYKATQPCRSLNRIRSRRTAIEGQWSVISDRKKVISDRRTLTTDNCLRDVDGQLAAGEAKVWTFTPLHEFRGCLRESRNDHRQRDGRIDRHVGGFCTLMQSAKD